MGKPKKLEYTTVREDWSKYKLDDDSVVKIKVTITEIIDTGLKKGKTRELKFGVRNMIFKEPTPDDKGEPSENQKILNGDIIQDLTIQKRISESLNIYDVPDKLLLLIRPRLKEIKKTKKFDLSGNRIYQYIVLCDASIISYPK